MVPDEINLQYTTIKVPLPDFIYEGLSTYSKGANTYRPQPEELVEAISVKHDIPKDMIFLTAGIDEAIQIFAKTYGQNSYVFTPTYVVYTDVEVFGGKLNRIYSVNDSEYKISSDTIPNATLIYLANPNNPSGVTPKESVIELIRNNSHSIVVIDEAYGEFADLSVINDVKNYPNTAVLRSFSKAYAMAGNRIGYVVANPNIISVIKDKTQWCNVSYLSVGAAVTALKNETFFSDIRNDINSRREQFIKYLTQSGYSVLPSSINAVLIKFGSESMGTEFFEYLGENGIITSHGNGNSNIGLDKSFVRIAIGTGEQMEILMKVIEGRKR